MLFILLYVIHSIIRRIIYNIIFNVTTLLFYYNINQIVKRSVVKMRLSVSLISIYGFGVLCLRQSSPVAESIIPYLYILYPPVFIGSLSFFSDGQKLPQSQEFYNGSVSTFFTRNTSIICRFRVIVIMPKTAMIFNCLVIVFVSLNAGDAW